ncbi:MAG: family efflux transporter permease subunit [Hyphomicrobiales bacterium]|nr:family efflux transporter permease subunit [Hyphomicrobiales bacterium]
MSARYSFVIPLIVGCAQFMHQFDGAVIATALPSMADSLREDPLRLNLAITCYLLALAVFVPISGWLADRFGAKRIYILAIVVFTLSSMLCGLAQSLPELVVSRVLQGIGGAMMTPVGRVIVVKSVPRAELVKAMSYVTIPGALAPLLGPSVGGFIVTYFSWPWIFFINLPIGILGIILVMVHIPEIKEDDVAPLDLAGFLLAAVSLASLVLGFESMGRGLLPVPVVVGLLAGGAVCGAIYLWHARRISNPIIDFSLLRIPTFRAAITGGGLFYMTTTSMVFLLALLLQLGFGFTAFEAGLTTLAGAVGSLLTRFAFRPVLRILGFRNLLIGNAALTGLYLLACGMFQISTPFVLMIIILFIGGLSRSTQFTAVQSFTYADMPSSLMSRATSFSSMAQQLAQTFGVGVAALVIHLSMLWHGGTVVTAADIQPAFFTIAIAVLGSTLVFLMLPKDAGSEIGNVGRPRDAR